ncbi:MAG: oligosaccharide flippase family protein [Silicimonas sp.]
MTSLPNTPAATGFVPHPSSGRSRAAVLGSLWSLLQTLIPSLSSALIFFMAAAYLTPADFGHLAIATGVVSIALAFSPVAFGEALVQRASLSPSHADAVFWLNAAFALLYCALLILAAPFVADWFGVPDIAWILPLLSLRVPFELVAAVPVAMITRAMQFRLLAIRTAIGSAVGTVVCLVLLLAGQGLLALVVSQVAVSATVCAVAVWSCGWRPGLSARLSDIRDLARYGTFAAGQRMLGTLRVDHLVTGALGGAVLLGLLVFAQRIFQLLANIASGALSSVMHVVLSSMQGEPEKAKRAFVLVSFAAAAIGFPVFAGAALVIDDIVRLFFADKWSEAAAAAQIFCVVGFIASLSIVQGALIRSRGKPDWLLWYQLAQEATTVLVIVLAWRHGVQVMVAAIAAKTFLIWPVSVWMTIRLLDCSLFTYARAFAGPALATAVMAGALVALPDAPGLGNLALQIAVGIAVYPPLLAALCHDRLTEAWRILRRKGPATA